MAKIIVYASLFMMAINTIDGMDNANLMPKQKQFNTHGSFDFSWLIEGKYPLTVMACLRELHNESEDYVARIVNLLGNDLLKIKKAGTALTKKSKEIISLNLANRFVKVGDKSIHFHYGVLKSYEGRNHYALYFLDNYCNLAYPHHRSIKSCGNYVKIIIPKYNTKLSKVVKVKYEEKKI